MTLHFEILRLVGKLRLFNIYIIYNQTQWVNPSPLELTERICSSPISRPHQEWSWTLFPYGHTQGLCRQSCLQTDRTGLAQAPTKNRSCLSNHPVLGLSGEKPFPHVPSLTPRCSISLGSCGLIESLQLSSSKTPGIPINQDFSSLPGSLPWGLPLGYVQTAHYCFSGHGLPFLPILNSK